MDQSQLLRYLIETLEALRIDYMLGGSQASIYYGEPRFTQDVDVIADIQATHLPQLVQRFPVPDFYLSAEAVAEAIRRRSQFNVIHPASGLKIDVILPKDTPYDRTQFARRQRLPLLPGTDAYFARPEDVILYKLLYYREGGSDKHLRDIAGMLAISGQEIELAYIDEWAATLGLNDIWQAIKTTQPA